MYNAEKYIGECLDSLLAQTFQNFEVIVVDDCSTDNSCALAESYCKTFGERFTFTKLKEHTGGGGEPRNRGLIFSRGEYVFFMDADDVLTQTALDEMYTLAKKFDADVVYCEKYFMSTGTGQDFVRNIHPADSRIQQPPFVEEPSLETSDLAKRVERALGWNYWVTPWLRLVSRNLLLENDIRFPSLIGSNDVGWTFKVLFCSKKFLRVPNACYIRRMHDQSVSLRKRTPPEHIHKWMDRTIRSLKDMDDFMSGIGFFKMNPVYRYSVLNSFVQWDFEAIFKESAELSLFEVYDIFRQKFGKYLGEHDVLVSALCTFVNTQQKMSIINQQKFNQFAAQVNQRIADFEKADRQNRAYASKLENLLAASQKQIAELRNEISRLKSKE